MKVEFLEPAEIEFNDAITYYNIQRNGLGFEFSKEVRHTINSAMFRKSLPQNA